MSVCPLPRVFMAGTSLPPLEALMLLRCSELDVLMNISFCQIQHQMWLLLGWRAGAETHVASLGPRGLDLQSQRWRAANTLVERR